MRVKDSEAATLKAFHGLDYFPLDRKWRIEARFEAAAEAREIPIPNALGFDEPILSPGHVVFTVGGQEHRLLALDDTGDGRLFLVFGDQTNGRETYGGGRFLYTDPPQDGRVVLDFNRAYNPPCVFTPYATCPLPPRENRLPFADRGRREELRRARPEAVTSDEGLYEKVLAAAGGELAAPETGPRPSAAVVLLRRLPADGIELFWLRRGEILPFMGGWHAFPGGGLERGDADLPVAGAPRDLRPDSWTPRSARRGRLAEGAGSRPRPRSPVRCASSSRRPGCWWLARRLRSRQARRRRLRRQRATGESAAR